MKRILLTLGIFFIASNAYGMNFPQKMKEHIANNKERSILYIFYSVNMSQAKDVNAIIQDVKTAAGPNYMGEVEQKIGNEKYVTLFALDRERATKKQLSPKPWFKKEEFVEDVLIHIDWKPDGK